MSLMSMYCYRSSLFTIIMNMLLTKNSQYNLLLFILIVPFKTMSHANHYFMEDFTPIKGSVSDLTCNLCLHWNHFSWSAATPKMLIVHKLCPKLEIRFKLGYG